MADEAPKTDAPPAEGEPKADEQFHEDAEGFGTSDVLLDSVTKDEWKNIEASLSYQKKNVAEMLKRACAQVRTKGEVVVDDSNGKFLGDMLPEMATFSTWCYKEHIRPKLQSLPLDLPDEEEAAADTDKKKKGKGGGGGGKGKGGGGKGGGDKIPAKVQIKIDNVLRIMKGEAAKDKGKSSLQIGANATGWLEALEPGKNLVLDAPWELQLAKEVGTAAAYLAPKKVKGEDKESTENKYKAVRNVADAIVVYENQFKIRYQVDDVPSLLMLADARHVLNQLKAKVKFTVHKCLRKYPALLSSSAFKSKHAAKFLQPYSSQLQLFKEVSKPGPRLVLLRSPPDTGKTSLAPALPELFPDHKVIFCCLARRVNLEVAQTLYNMGIPFAWIHNSLITCSWLCGLRGASTSKVRGAQFGAILRAIRSRPPSSRYSRSPRWTRSSASGSSASRRRRAAPGSPARRACASATSRSSGGRGCSSATSRRARGCASSSTPTTRSSSSTSRRWAPIRATAAPSARTRSRA